ncbi:hypothetical protein QYE76_005792 [Lolium multiflorum]|uniref:Reverse transcriptase Ty1/copia-type domain-containing protein n=1 Tax=Lolium multiflorum TaxID=4521 RepID=A0AAD8RV66_LOLMU|nr:hypothetical protein QYE76_005792 [Lolium multiflorum]
MPTSTTSLLITYTACFALVISRRIYFIVLARELLLSPPRPTLASVAVTLVHMVVTMDVMTAVTIVVISMVVSVVMMLAVAATMMAVVAAMMMMAGVAATMMMVVIVVTMMMLVVATVMIVMVADASVMMCVVRRTTVAEMMGARYMNDDSDDDDACDEKTANIVSYGVDTNWYSDTGATDPITRELSKLSMHEKYNVRDRVNTTNVNDDNSSEDEHVGENFAQNDEEMSENDQETDTNLEQYSPSTDLKEDPPSPFVRMDPSSSTIVSSPAPEGGSGSHSSPLSPSRTPTLTYDAGRPRSRALALLAPGAADSTCSLSLAATSLPASGPPSGSPALSTSVLRPVAGIGSTAGSFVPPIPVSSDIPGEPSNLSEAHSDVHWRKAMENEHDAFLKNKTWHLVPPSSGKNLIDCKWVYRIKKYLDDTTDYEDTFSPVVKEATIRIILALLVSRLEVAAVRCEEHVFAWCSGRGDLYATTPDRF